MSCEQALLCQNVYGSQLKEAVEERLRLDKNGHLIAGASQEEVSMNGFMVLWLWSLTEPKGHCVDGFLGGYPSSIPHGCHSTKWQGGS